MQSKMMILSRKLMPYGCMNELVQRDNSYQYMLSGPLMNSMIAYSIRYYVGWCNYKRAVGMGSMVDVWDQNRHEFAIHESCICSTLQPPFVTFNSTTPSHRDQWKLENNIHGNPYIACKHKRFISNGSASTDFAHSTCQHECNRSRYIVVSVAPPSTSCSLVDYKLPHQTHIEQGLLSQRWSRNSFVKRYVSMGMLWYDIA